MKKVLFAVMLVMAMLTSFMESSAQAGDKKSQLEVLDEKAKSDVKFGLEDLDTLRTEVNKMKKRLGGLARVDKELGDRITKLELQIADLVIKLDKLSGPSPEIPGILSRIGKLEREGGVINGRLDKIDAEIAALQDNDVVQDHRLDKIEAELDRGLGVKLGMGVYGVTGTNGVLSGGLMLTMDIPVYSDFGINLTGGVGANHEGGSIIVDVSFRYVAKNFSAGIVVGLDANADGFGTRLTTEMYGVGPTVEFRFAEDWFLLGRVLFGSEWIQTPTQVIEYDDRTVYKTDESRDFGVSGSLGLGRWF